MAQRRLMWRKAEETALWNLLKRHTPQQIFDKCAYVKAPTRGVKANTAEKRLWVADFSERKALFRAKGSKQPADDALCQMYLEDFPGDLKLSGFETWKDTHRKWQTEIRKKSASSK